MKLYCTYSAQHIEHSTLDSGLYSVQNIAKDKLTALLKYIHIHTSIYIIKSVKSFTVASARPCSLRFPVVLPSAKSRTAATGTENRSVYDPHSRIAVIL